VRVPFAKAAICRVQVLQPRISGQRAVDAGEAVDGPAHLLLHARRRRTEALDDHQLGGTFGKAPRIVGHDFAAHRVPDEHRTFEAERANEVVQVEDEMTEAIVGRGLAVAVPAQVEGQNVKAVEQPARQIVEGVRVIAQPMDDDERRQGRIAPVAKVHAQRAAAEKSLAELWHREAER